MATIHIYNLLGFITPSYLDLSWKIMLHILEKYQNNFEPETKPLTFIVIQLVEMRMLLWMIRVGEALKKPEMPRVQNVGEAGVEAQLNNSIFQPMWINAVPSFQ